MGMDVAFDPIQVGPFRVNRVMMQPHKTADLLQQSGRLGLTLHGIALIFWMVIQLQKEVQDH